MDTDSKNGANPLDRDNPLRTGNFNKIVMYVFLIILVGMLTAIAVIKMNFGGSFHRSPASTASHASPQ